MSKYLQCYEINYKEMILKMTKQRVVLITMRIVWVLDVKKVANELSGPQADNENSNPPEIFHKNVFLTKSFDWNTLYGYLILYIHSFSVLSMHKIQLSI